MIAEGTSAIAYTSAPLWVSVQVSLWVSTGNQGPRQPECSGTGQMWGQKTWRALCWGRAIVAAIFTLTEPKHFYLKALFKGHWKGRRRIRTYLAYHINKSLYTDQIDELTFLLLPNSFLLLCSLTGDQLICEVTSQYKMFLLSTAHVILWQVDLKTQSHFSHLKIPSKMFPVLPV